MRPSKIRIDVCYFQRWRWRRHLTLTMTFFQHFGKLPIWFQFGVFLQLCTFAINGLCRSNFVLGTEASFHEFGKSSFVTGRNKFQIRHMGRIYHFRGSVRHLDLHSWMGNPNSHNIFLTRLLPLREWASTWSLRNETMRPSLYFSTHEVSWILMMQH